MLSRDEDFSNKTSCHGPGAEGRRPRNTTPLCMYPLSLVMLAILRCRWCGRNVCVNWCQASSRSAWMIFRGTRRRLFDDPVRDGSVCTVDAYDGLRRPVMVAYNGVSVQDNRQLAACGFAKMLDFLGSGKCVLGNKCVCEQRAIQKRLLYQFNAHKMAQVFENVGYRSVGHVVMDNNGMSRAERQHDLQ